MRYEQIENFFKAFRGLSPKERQIVMMRQGMTDGVFHTLEEVGKHFGVTRERIRQIEAKSYEWLRVALKEIPHIINNN